MLRNITVICALLLLISTNVRAQFRLRVPSFEIAVKAGYLYHSDDQNYENGQYFSAEFESVYAQGEINVHIGQHISAGYFYQKSIMGTYRSDTENGGNSYRPTPDRNAEQLSHGFNLRISAGRAAKFRPYLQAKYYTNQVVVNYDGFNVAFEGKVAAAGFGVMLRLGHRLYINLIEAEANFRLDAGEIIFRRNDVFPSARTGLTYNFSKRK